MPPYAPASAFDGWMYAAYGTPASFPPFISGARSVTDFSALCITCAEKRSEGLLVAILPRLKCCRVDDVYESIEIDYGPK